MGHGQFGILVSATWFQYVYWGACLCPASTINCALTSSTASAQFHSCGEEDILIGSFLAVGLQTSQLGARNIAVGGEGQVSPGGRVNHQS